VRSVVATARRRRRSDDREPRSSAPGVGPSAVDGPHVTERAGPPCHNRCMPTRDEVLEALKSVIDPEIRKDVVELGMVREISIGEDRVDVKISLTTSGCPLRNHFVVAVRKALRSIGV